MLIGSSIIYREKVSSTNELASELISGLSPAEGTVIYAGQQLKGKGQRGNTWISDKDKNLTVSIILYPHFLQAERQFMVSKVISLAICQLFDPYSDKIRIKWPNDIYHKDDKIAGILLEYSLQGNTIQSCIAGAGININQDSFPPELPNPVSLKLITGREYNIKDILSDLCRLSDLWYTRLRNGHYDQIDAAYRARLYRLNYPSEFIAGAGSIRGKIKGVDTYGRLIIRLKDGSTGMYGFNEISFSH